MTTENWSKCIAHIQNEEKKTWDVDNMADKVINVRNSDIDDGKSGNDKG